MPKTKHGSTVSVYLNYEQDKYIQEQAKEESKSKSSVINEIVLSFKKTDGRTFINKKLILSLLPLDRKFTELEAAFSVVCDYESDLPATIFGYAKKWGWSRRQVRNLLKNSGFKIIYIGNVRRGYIKKTS